MLSQVSHWLFILNSKYQKKSLNSLVLKIYKEVKMVLLSLRKLSWVLFENFSCNIFLFNYVSSLIINNLKLQILSLYFQCLKRKVSYICCRLNKEMLSEWKFKLKFCVCKHILDHLKVANFLILTFFLSLLLPIYSCWLNSCLKPF